MKRNIILIAIAVICSCNKNSTITDNTISSSTPPTETDSAKLFLITASINTGSKSMIAYDNSKIKKWEQNSILPITFWSKPAFVDNRIYFTSSNKLVSINSETGSTIWTSNSIASFINPRINNDTIVTALSLNGVNPQNSLLLLDKFTGNVIWNKILNYPPVTTPILDGNKIFVLTSDAYSTSITLSSYDITTNNLIWQKILVNGIPLMAMQSEMIMKNDTLIIGAAANQINAINKNTGLTYWSKSINATNVFLYNNKIVYNDDYFGRLTMVNLQDGKTVFQSDASNAVVAAAGNKLSYIYKDALYFQALDTVYCTSLSDGSLKWKKHYNGFYQKMIVIGKYAYGARLYENTNDELKLMTFNAENFTVKDSIIVPKRDYINFSIIGSNNLLY